jgi:predicted AAA+ superfamily ATPase
MSNMERLILQYRALLERTSTQMLRFIQSKINWDNRMIAILGPRGVGKTTVMLQYIKLHLNPNEALYVSADDFYFNSSNLFDLAHQFQLNGGKHLFIDEVHKYANWSQELKMMYDNLPNLKITVTGSSILDLYKGTDDLSRRVVRYNMNGLSFREYLNLNQELQLPTYTLQEILEHQVELPSVEFPLVHFKKYLTEGYYPFSIEPDFSIRLLNILNMTLETDIPMYAKMNIGTAQKIKQLLGIISESVPFKPNLTKIAEMVGVHRNQIVEYLHFLEKSGIILQLRDATNGIRALGKVDKIYLENTNLMYAIGKNATDIGNVRETYFFNQLQQLHEVYKAPKSDFLIEGYTFEIGGKNKSGKQLKDTSNAFVVKDDILYAYQNTIPLWHFGMMY